MHAPATVVDADGDLFDADADALVNPVNCVGVMGKGLALEFRQRFPANYARYRIGCQRGELRPGRILVGSAGRQQRPQFIVNFPTKRHWRDASRLDDIEAGLVDLADWLRLGWVSSIAVPALGCGLGGLPWAVVRPRIADVLGGTGVRVLVYGPRS